MRILGGTASSYVAPPLPVVSGGTLSSDATYYYRTFTSNGSFIVAVGAISVDIYRVSGGTGGLLGFGGIAGGGGGAGYVSAPISRSALGTYTVSIGAGGASDSAGSSSNVSGSFSPSIPPMPIFPAPAGDDIGYGQPCFQVNSAMPPYRYGGMPSGSNAGGGAGVNGDGQSRPTGGNGGAGYTLPTGSNVGGGGGGGGSPAGTGSFGGGNGNGGNAAVNTGSGGGGSNLMGGIGGNGGSGIVVFRYLRSAVGG